MDQSRYAQERMEQQLNSAQELVRGSLLQVYLCAWLRLTCDT